MRFQGRTVDRMAADGQRFHERELLEAELAGNVQLAGGHQKPRPQAAVAVDAERLMFFAAIGVAAAGRRSTSGN